MAINTYLRIVTLNANELNAPIKKNKVTEWIKIINKTHVYTAYKRIILDWKTLADCKWGERETSIMQMNIQRKPE